MSRSFGACEGKEVVGTAAAWPCDMVVPGERRVDAAAVTGVGVLPTHQRRGILTDLMRSQLGRRRRDAGRPPVAILYPRGKREPIHLRALRVRHGDGLLHRLEVERGAGLHRARRRPRPDSFVDPRRAMQMSPASSPRRPRPPGVDRPAGWRWHTGARVRRPVPGRAGRRGSSRAPRREGPADGCVCLGVRSIVTHGGASPAT